jgi:hypothetical protein
MAKKARALHQRVARRPEEKGVPFGTPFFRA